MSDSTEKRQLACEDDCPIALVVKANARLFQGYALSLVKNEADADDLVQESFAIALNKRSTFRKESTLSTWIMSIMRNEAYRKFRRSEVEKRHEQSVIDLSIDAGWGTPLPKHIDEQRRIELLREALNELPITHREIIYLRDLLEIDGEQSAAILGISLAAVKTRLHRARLTLRKKMEKTMNEDVGVVLDGISCGQVLNRLGGFLEGDVDASTKDTIVGHVTQCSNCEQFLETHQQLIVDLRKLTIP